MQAFPLGTIFVGTIVILSGCMTSPSWDSRDTQVGPPLSHYQGCWEPAFGDCTSNLTQLTKSVPSPPWRCHERIHSAYVDVTFWSNPVDRFLGVRFESVENSEVTPAFVLLDDVFQGWAPNPAGGFYAFGKGEVGGPVVVGLFVASIHSNVSALANPTDVVPQAVDDWPPNRILFQFDTSNGTYVFPAFAGITRVWNGEDFELEIEVEVLTVGTAVAVSGSPQASCGIPSVLPPG